VPKGGPLVQNKEHRGRKVRGWSRPPGHQLVLGAGQGEKLAGGEQLRREKLHGGSKTKKGENVNALRRRKKRKPLKRTFTRTGNLRKRIWEGQKGRNFFGGVKETERAQGIMENCLLRLKNGEKILLKTDVSTQSKIRKVEMHKNGGEGRIFRV